MTAKLFKNKPCTRHRVWLYLRLIKSHEEDVLNYILPIFPLSLFSMHPVPELLKNAARKGIRTFSGQNNFLKIRW